MPLLRPCSTALGLDIALGKTDRGSMADLFTITLQSGTVYRWTTYNDALSVGGHFFDHGSSAGGTPWLSRSRWNVVNTLEVPTLEIFLDTTSVSGFAGGPVLLAQIQNGLFDGGTCLLQRVWMPTPGDTTTWGTIDLFLGDIGAASISAPRATIKVRGKSFRLNAESPRNVYQPGCIHSFCDAGCTLSAGTFTYAFTVGSTPAPTRSVIQIVGSTPAVGFARLKSGTLTMTSGAANHLVKAVIDIGGGGSPVVTLVSPLLATPAIGDSLTIFAACDKTAATCTTPYANFANFRGFPLIPAPESSSPP